MPDNIPDNGSQETVSFDDAYAKNPVLNADVTLKIEELASRDKDFHLRLLTIGANSVTEGSSEDLTRANQALLNSFTSEKLAKIRIIIEEHYRNYATYIVQKDASLN